MNTVEHYVVEVVKEPHQVVIDEKCCWCVVVKVNCYGRISEETFEFVYKRSAEERAIIGSHYLA